VLFQKEDFKHQHHHKMHSGRFRGTRNARGYRMVKIKGANVLAHRLAWCLYYGGWPLEEIDHKNCIKDDNRIDNLRVATRHENQRNTRLQKNNSSGHKGVYKASDCDRWVVRIKQHGKNHYVGMFVKKEDAIDAHKEELVRRFGEFARYK